MDTFIASCWFWLPIQSFNFFLLPPKYHISYVAITQFAWANIACIIKNDKSENEEDVEDVEEVEEDIEDIDTEQTGTHQ